MLGRADHRPELLARLDFPNLQHVIRAAGDELLAVGFPIDREDVTRVPFVGSVFLSAINTRDFQEFVAGTAREQAAIGAELDAEDGVGVERVERSHEHALADFP